ncbi:MAB_1171c family putative transporter [Streptomyces avermitilis]|uniref:MAB_1171c family putative transporter n=1 Tax=Streptomyces avermitilis TaxID=33903 RepID=UPI003687D8F0
MPTDDVIDLLTTVPLWAVVAFRLYTRPTTSGQWAIMWTFATLAVGATLRLTVIEHALADSTGIDDLAILPKHLLVMLSCMLLLGWVESIVPPRAPEPAWRRWTQMRPRMIVFAVTGVAATLAFPFAAHSVTAPDGSTDFATPQYGDLAGTLHLTLYLLPMGLALTASAALCLTAARRTQSRLFRLCMRLQGAGAAVGALYPVYRFSYLFCGLTGWNYPLTELQFHRGASLIQFVTIAMTIVGSSVRAADVVIRAIRQRRSLIALRPLWVELVSVLPPETILRHLQTGTSPTEDRRRLRDLYGRLDERVVEIVDASVTLRPWIEKTLPARALAAARATGLHGAEARAACEALCLHVARTKAVEGEPYERSPAVAFTLSMRDDLESSAAWLTSVASHHASTDIVDTARALADQNSLQEASA